MANNRDLLKEAIAEAKAIRETALANAKAALEESFTPHLKSAFVQKLEEMEKEEMYEKEEEMMNETSKEVEEELNLEALLAELEEGEDLTEAKEEDKEEEDDSEKEEEKEEEEDEEKLDLEDMTEEDLEKMITDIIKDMLEDGELESLEGEEEMEDETMEELPMTEMEDETMEEEVNIDELLSEILSEEEEIEEIFGLGKKKEKRDGYQEVIQDLLSSNKDLVDKIASASSDEEKRKLADPLLKKALSAFQQLKREMPGEDVIANMNEFKRELFGDSRSLLQKVVSGARGGGEGMKESYDKMSKELSEAYKTINHLRSELNEINLLNAKLLYVNKIFRAKNLNESQKVTILETFDKAKNVGEVKLVYETLNGGIKSRSPKSTITEGRGSSSKATGKVTTNEEPIIVNEAFERMKQLAFYQSKH